MLLQILTSYVILDFYVSKKKKKICNNMKLIDWMNIKKKNYILQNLKMKYTWRKDNVI